MNYKSYRPNAADLRFFVILYAILIYPTGSGYCDGKHWNRIGLEIPSSIYSIAVDPSDLQTIYAGTHNGGVYKSTDGGKHWRQTSLSNIFASTLLIDSQNTQIVYAGSYSGVYKSVNGGEDWDVLMNGDVTSMAMVSESSGQRALYAGTRDRGIFKSTDQGRLWKQKGLSDLQVVSLAVDPKSPDTIYAGTYNGGLYKTVDGGNIWTHVGLDNAWVQVLQIDPDDPQTVYAGTVNGNCGLFRSTDAGLNWQQLTRGAVWSMAISPIPLPLFMQRAIYVGTSTGIIKSTDKGNTWQATDLDYSFLPIHCLAIDPLHTQTVYAGTEGEGAFKSIDGGGKWNSINTGLNDTSILSLVVDPSDPHTLYAGAYGGVFKSVNKGGTWVNLGLRKTIAAVLTIDPLANQTIYAGTMEGVYKSVDGGNKWTAINTGFGLYPVWVKVLVINPVDTNILYAGTTTGLFKSVNGGTSWQQSGMERIHISAIAIDPLTPTTIYAGSYAGGILKSINSGTDWNPINGSLANPQISSIAIDPTNPNTIFISTDSGGLFKSINGGTDWITIGNSLLTNSKLAMDPSNPKTLYAFSSTRALLISNDGGDSWSLLNSGLPNNSILCLAIDPTARQTPYIGTYGSGIWAYSLDLSLNLGAGGTAKASTGRGDGDILSGIAEVVLDSGSVPYGAAVIRLKQDGVTVSETVVPSTPPVTKTRIFIDYRSNVLPILGQQDSGSVNIDTGLAIVNYKARAANLTYTLRDMSGNTLAVGHGIVQGRGYAKFISQLKEVAPDFILPPDFPTAIKFGSLEIDSDEPVGVLAMRMTINQRHEVVLTTTASTDLGSYTGKRYIPQIANGGGYITSICLLNTANTIQKGMLRFFNDDGIPLTVSRVDGAQGSSFGYSIPPNGSFHFQTDGSPNVVAVGWVELDPGVSSVPDGTGIISFNQENVLISETGIAVIGTTNHARVHIDLSELHNTGIAIANPSDTDLLVTVKAFQADGISAAGTSGEVLSLPGKGHKSKFADELAKGLPAGFIGVLDISSSNNFSIVTARSIYNERKEFIMSAMPVADFNGLAPSPIVFPRVVSGDGYVTDFILLSSGGEANATLSLYGDDAISIDLHNQQ